jgi:hypothetical protein
VLELVVLRCRSEREKEIEILLLRVGCINSAARLKCSTWREHRVI